MLACARIGAIHSVVFGGFAAASLATRIDDAQPKVMVTSDAGMRGGKAVPYKHLVDEAIRLAQHPPPHVVIVNRGPRPGDDDASPGATSTTPSCARSTLDAQVPVRRGSSRPSRRTSSTRRGTTGKPKGVQRDTGGYAVALAASMRDIFCVEPGETMFTTTDIGWVVGHSYIVYGPLINGSTTIMYEGLPIRPDPAIWWKIVAEHKVKTMFSSPTAIRVLKKQDPAYMTKYDTAVRSSTCSSPASRSTSRRRAGWRTTLGVRRSSTTTGRPRPAGRSCPRSLGVEETPRKFGSPSFPVYGYDVRLLHEATGEEVGADEKGVLTIVPPLPPGCMTTVWGDDERFVKTYFGTFRDELVYSTFDWATRDADGYYFVLGRTDDVINVAGHRLGTREIEEAVQAHAGIAEVAVVGVADALKGQMPGRLRRGQGLRRRSPRRRASRRCARR